MGTRFETAITSTLSAIVIFHMTFTVISYSATAEGMLGASKFYTDDVFFQRWNFFAPNPGILTEKLWIRCSNEGISSEWIDPVAEVLAKSYYSPLPSNYRRTYALRELTSRVNRALSKLTVEECHSEDFSLEQSLSSQSSRADVELSEVSVCKTAFDKVKKTKVYRDLVHVSRYICQNKFNLPPKINPSIIISQKHPWPLSLAGRVGVDSPYYKLSVVDFEKGVGQCQKN